MWNDSPLTTIQIRQGPFARPALPGVNTTMSPSDSLQSQKTVIDSHRLLADRYTSSVRPLSRVSQVPDCSIDARCPQSPRAARWLHTPVTSPPVRGFAQSERLATTKLCHEAESGSLTLRLTSSPKTGLHRAGYPDTMPAWLHGQQAITMISSFQLTRTIRLTWHTEKHKKARKELSSHG